jgi:anti-sigma factor RsiW
MHDPWTDRLSAYIDGELDDADARALETHLRQCDVCTTTLAGLRDVVAAARTLPDHEPPHDLWAGIAAGIAADTAAREVDVLPLRPRRAVAARFSFTAPQLAAAALVLMTLSGAAVWFAVGSDTRAAAANGAVAAGTIFQSAVGAPADVRLAAVPAPVAGAAEDAREIEAALESARGTLDPSTVAVLERSIESIEAAIADARAALEADPGNPYLQRQLDSTLQRRQDVLRRASGVRRAGA